MIDDPNHGKPEDIQSHIDDLIKTLTDQNASQNLVAQCLEHLHAVLEMLGEAKAARSVRKQMGDGDDDNDGLAIPSGIDDKW